MVSVMAFLAKIPFLSKILPLFKKFWSVAIIIILVFYIIMLKFSLMIANNKYQKCENNIDKIVQEFKQSKEKQDIKIEYVDRIIEKEVIKYKDKIKYVKEYVKDENKSDCDNALFILRDNF